MNLGNVRKSSLSINRIYKTWWPLAASWLLMGAELPALTAVIARLNNPEINLAAYGGIVFPISLIIESPIIMLLAASTALSKDWTSYVKLRRFMMTTSAALTTIHILVAFTPLYYFVANRVIGAPQEIIEPARTGLMIMTPWTWSIAFRRFNQGVLIRFGHSQAISLGTIVRLSTDCIVLGFGYILHTVPGIVVGTCAVAAGVVSEALFIWIVVKPVLQGELKNILPISHPITLREFIDFYIPLAMTSLLFILAQPIGSAALSRMPQAIESLAVWPVVSGFIFMLRSMGMAYNEVVVTLLDEPNPTQSLLRFTKLLIFTTSTALLVIVATPIAKFWFEGISGLNPELAEIARIGVWLALPLPALSVLQNWYQGMILYSKKTRGITEAVVIYLLVIGSVFTAGVYWGKTTGLYFGIAAMDISMTAQTIWLWYRSRRVFRLIGVSSSHSIS